MGGAERGQHNNAEQSQHVCNDGFHWPGQFGAARHLSWARLQESGVEAFPTD